MTFDMCGFSHVEDRRLGAWLPQWRVSVRLPARGLRLLHGSNADSLEKAALRAGQAPALLRKIAFQS
jgi:hypothetical protein